MESDYYVGVISNAFSWFTSTLSKLYYLAPGKANEFYGFPYYRYAWRGTTTPASRDASGGQALAIMSPQQRQMLFDIVPLMVNMTVDYQNGRIQGMNEMWKLREDPCAVINEELVLSGMAAAGNVEGIMAGITMRTFKRIENTLNSTQWQLIRSIRTGNVTVPIPSDLYSPLPGYLSNDAIAYSGKLFTYLTGTRFESTYIEIGRPANVFGFIELRVEARYDALRGDAADMIQNAVLNTDRFSQEIMYGVVKNQRLLFRDMLQARDDLINYLYDYKEGLFADLNNATLQALGAAYARLDGSLGLAQVMAYAAVFHRQPLTTFNQLTSFRANVTNNTDFGPSPQPNSNCSQPLRDLSAITSNSTTASAVWRSSNGVLCKTLHVREGHYYNKRMAFLTRTYEGIVPGPVIRVRAGDKIHIQLVNELLPRCTAESSLTCCMMCLNASNREACPTTTNLHTHGLHIPGIGIGDNVLRKAEPGQSLVYQYNIPADHAPGMFFYHPHHHGSTALQVMGGMMGVIIVEDNPSTPNYTPELAAMREHILAMAMFTMVEDNSTVGGLANDGEGAEKPYSTIQTISGDPMFPRLVWSGAPGNHYVVNGQYLPTLTMQPGELRRLRILNAGITHILELGIEKDRATGNNSPCEMWLLARDGVFRRTPSLRQVIVMAPANRIELAFRCNATGVFTLSGNRTHGGNASATLRDSILDPSVARFEGPIMYFNISGPSMVMRVPSVLPDWPSYLFDMTNTPPPSNCSSCFFNLTLNSLSLNGVSFPHMKMGSPGVVKDASAFLWNMSANAIQEWKLLPGKNHPLHIHVNHFMLTDCKDCEGADW